MTALGWNDLESAKSIHAFFELGGLVLFAVLVLFEILAHRHTKRENLFRVLALVSFALAVGFELLAYPYSRRVEKLSDEKISELESALKPKPLDLRIREFLNELDPRILTGLIGPEPQNAGRLLVKMPQLPQSKAEKLQSLCAEAGASEYIRIERVANSATLITINGIPTTTVDADFLIYTKLLDHSDGVEPHRKPN